MTKQLIDRDEVLKILSDLLEGHNLDYSTWKINNLPIESQWIDVKDRLPEVGIKVLISDKNGVTKIAILSKFGEWRMPGFGFSLPTHWQPLPLHPK